MNDTALKLGDDVLTPRARGTIIDLRPAPSGAWLFGVEYADGEVGYFTARALRPAQSSQQ